MSRYRQEADDILARLRGVGIDVPNFAQLRRLKKYPAAVPILLKSLRESSDPDVKEDIVRSLSMPWAGSEVARVLVDEFEAVDNELLKWAIGNGLSIVADSSVATDVIRLAKDRRHGRAREMLAVALGRLRDPKAAEAARELLDDDEVEGHAIIALGKLRAANAEHDIAQRLHHPKSWIREEARKALAKIRRRSGPRK